jgi:hypothetical protein
MLDKRSAVAMKVNVIEPFPYVEVPKSMWHIVGKPVEDTRIHRVEGPPEHVSAWYEAVCDIVKGPCVSPGGGCMFVPVGRSAIHQRIQQGKLTCFMYDVQEKISILGFKIALRDAPYSYVPVSELKEWRTDIEHRLMREGTISREELEGAKPDWAGPLPDATAKGARGRKSK